LLDQACKCQLSLNVRSSGESLATLRGSGDTRILQGLVAMLLSEDGRWINGQVHHVNGGALMRRADIYWEMSDESRLSGWCGDDLWRQRRERSGRGPGVARAGTPVAISLEAGRGGKARGKHPQPRGGRQHPKVGCT